MPISQIRKLEAQRMRMHYSTMLIVCQALVLSTSHKLTYLKVTSALRPRYYFHSHFIDAGTKSQVVWAGTCVHTLRVNKVSIGQNLGAYTTPVDFNQVPWGWVFVHAFTSHTWPGCAGGWGPTHL